MINDVKSNGNSVRVCVNIKTLENITNSVNIIKISSILFDFLVCLFISVVNMLICIINTVSIN